MPYAPQFELLDALYVILRQMPRYRCGYTPLAAAAAAGTTSNALGEQSTPPLPPQTSGPGFDNMSEFLAYRWGSVW
jgi:hypothetical protein